MPAAATKAGAGETARPSKRYMRLVRDCPLLPIRSDAALDRAIAALDRLLGRGDLTEEEEGYKLVLGDLIESYESARYPEPVVPPSATLRHLIEAKGVSQARLAAETGVSAATLSRILAGRRPPSRRSMAALAAYFRADPSVFL
jgi:HTH-type transcriptional regulator/antitoxin HigA